MTSKQEHGTFEPSEEDSPDDFISQKFLKLVRSSSLVQNPSQAIAEVFKDKAGWTALVQ